MRYGTCDVITLFKNLILPLIVKTFKRYTQ
jgi:hypothetical protein